MDRGVWEEEQSLVWKLYRNVENMAQIRKLIFTAHLPFALVNPKLIVDPFHMSAAVTKALFSVKEGTMTTRSLPTEIVYALSPSKNITESLKQFSAQDGDKELLLVGDKLMFSKVGGQIQGEEMPLSQLSLLTDINLVKSVYQVSDEELRNSSLVGSVVSRMASKGFATGSLANNAPSSSS